MWKEVRDQALHFSIGTVATFALGLFIPFWLASILVLSFAIGREIHQRLSVGAKWYSCGDGCRLDLLFWSLGISAGTFLAFILINL